jgi:hypothetical protein
MNNFYKILGAILIFAGGFGGIVKPGVIPLVVITLGYQFWLYAGQVDILDAIENIRIRQIPGGWK